MSTSIRRVTTTLVLDLAALTFAPILLADSAPSTYLWYPGARDADIITTRVRPAITAPTTYFAAMTWNAGRDGGGDCGIQDQGNSRNFIFSLWDPTSVAAQPTAIYTAPGGQVSRFSGEGTGLHYLLTTPWQTGQWYRLVVRAWDNGTHTYVGMWTLDETANTWTHHITMDYPVAHLRLNNIASFLEDWGNTGATVRRMEANGGYERATQANWTPWNTATFTTATTTGQYANAYDGGTQNGVFYMQAGGTTTPTVPLNATLTVSMPTQPTFPTGKVATAAATYNQTTNQLTVAWTNDLTTSPQFAYKIEVFNNASLTGSPVLSQSDIAPDTRSIVLTSPLAAGAYYARVVGTDIFDQVSTPQVVTVTSNPSTSIYTNLNGTAASGSWVVGQYSPGNSYVLAAAFTPSGQDYTLTQIQTLLYLSTGRNEVMISLRADAGGTPGTILESWDLANVLSTARSLVTATSVLHPTLKSGNRYWVTAAMADPTATGGWSTNPVGAQGLRSYSLNGGPFTTGTQSTNGLFEAFGVTGTPTNNQCTTPTITTQPQSQTIGNGQTATLTVTAAGTAPFTYQWTEVLDDYGIKVGSNSSTLTTPALDHTALYWVDVSNACGHLSSAIATITVQASCTLACAATVPNSGTTNTAVQFSSSSTAANCATSPTYDWDFGDGTAHSIQQNPTHTYVTSGTYNWKLTIAAGGTITCTKIGTIAVLPACTSPSISAQPQNQTVNSGQSTTLTVTANGTTSLNYAWYQGNKGDTNHPVGNNSNSFTTPALTITTTYWVRVTNTCGNTDSTAVTVTVVTTTSSGGAVYHFDEGSGTAAKDASGNGNDGTITGATYATGYTGTALHFRANTLDAVTIPQKVFQGWTNTAYFQAMIRPTAYPDNYDGGWAVIFIKNAPYNAWWVALQSDGALVTYLFSSNYMTSNNDADVIKLTTATRLVNLNTWAKITAWYDGTTYHLSINDVEAATESQTITIDWNTGYQYTQLGGNKLINGGNQTFNGDIDEVIISSTNSGVTTTCTAPTITAQPASTTITSGSTTTLTATAAGTAPLSYQWYQGSAGDTSHPVGANNTGFTTPALTATTTYWVRVTNACGSADSSTATIAVPSSTLPSFTAAGVVNAASGQPGLVPGSLASIYGANLATSTAQATSTSWPTTLGGAKILVNGVYLAPLYYASSGQLNFQVPWEIAGGVNTTIAVSVNGTMSPIVNVPVLAAQPGIFVINGRQSLAYNFGATARPKNGTFVTAVDPARPGDVVVLYATGLGAVSPRQQNGVPASTGASITGDITVFVAGTQADVLFAGLAPGYIGLYQLNVRVPSALTGKTLTVRVGGGEGSATIAAAADGAWIETFDTLDPTRWRTTTRASVEGTSKAGCVICNYGSFDPRWVQIANGYLVLQLDQRLVSPLQVASVGGEISSVEQFSYGTYEFRIRMSSTAVTPSGDGVCLPGSVSGAFNYLYNPATDKSETEIDFEGLGDQPDRVNTTSWHGSAPQQTGTIRVPNLCQQFFTYRFTWDPSQISFSTDGSPDPPPTPFTTTVPSKPAAITLNHWGTVDPAWGGDPSTDATGQAFSKSRFLYVDWVKFTPRGQ